MILTFFRDIVQNFFELRSLKKLDQPTFCEDFLFYLSFSSGTIREQNTKAETHLDSFVQIFNESTDEYFPPEQVKRHIAKQSWKTNRIKRFNTKKDKMY